MTDLLDSIRRHRSTAMGIARGFLRKLPPSIQLADIEQAALIGLFLWKRSHPDEQAPGWIGGLKIRIRGSIKDELRRHDWLPRYERKRRQERGESVSHVIGCADADPLWEQNWTDGVESAETALERKQEVAQARQAPLDGRIAQVIDLHYFRGEKFKDIGAGLGVSEARISQLHHRGLERMREHVEREQKRDRRNDHAKERPVPRQSGFYRMGTLECVAPLPDLEEPMTATLPEDGLDLRAELARYQDWMVEQALIRTNGCKAQAARLLGLERTCLVEMLKSRRRLKPGPPQADDEPKTDPGVLRIPRSEIARLKAEGKTARQAASILGVNRWLVEREYARPAGLAKCGPKEDR
jgi:RNA polymerase sigma factor (sigma-70 family)